jgi:acyl-CoA reductase-like NAD-dependent aldehyde dehydrogenase
VVVAVSAFNHPLNLIVRQVAPAAGCPVIVKPATDTPLFCLRFFSILHEAGLPHGWCQALVIASRALSQQLVTDVRSALAPLANSKLLRASWSSSARTLGTCR